MDGVSLESKRGGCHFLEPGGKILFTNDAKGGISADGWDYLEKANPRWNFPY
jgi:hypothetical protein